MTEEIHYCKNCKYVKINFFEKMISGYEFAKCLAFPDIEDSDGETLVQGKAVIEYNFCYVIRHYRFSNKKTCPKYEEK